MPVPLEILDEELSFIPRLQLDACQLVSRRFRHRIETRAGVFALHPISSFGIFPDERTGENGSSTRSFYLQAIYTGGKFVMLFNDEGDANKLVGFMMYLRNAYVHKKLAFDFVHLPTITLAQAETLSAIQCGCRMLSLENVTGTLEVIRAVLSAISVKEEVHITTCNDEVVSTFLSTCEDSPPEKATVEYPVVPSTEAEALDDYYIRHLIAMSKFNGKSSLSVFNYYPQMDFFEKLLSLFKSTSYHEPAAHADIVDDVPEQNDAIRFEDEERSAARRATFHFLQQRTLLELWPQGAIHEHTVVGSWIIYTVRQENGRSMCYMFNFTDAASPDANYVYCVSVYFFKTDVERDAVVKAIEENSN